MQLAGIVFQACSFNHSDISPFRLNDLRLRARRDPADCDTSSNVSRSLMGWLSITVVTPGEPVAQSTGRVPSELLVRRYVAGDSVRGSDRAELIVWVAMNLSSEKAGVRTTSARAAARARRPGTEERAVGAAVICPAWADSDCRDARCRPHTATV